KCSIERGLNWVRAWSGLAALISKAPEMSSGTLPARNPAGHSGLLEHALALISAVVAFFESRFVLLAQESKSAAVQVLILVGCVIAALALCLMGYVFLIVSGLLVARICSEPHGQWWRWLLRCYILLSQECCWWWHAVGSPSRCFGIAL